MPVRIFLLFILISTLIYTNVLLSHSEESREELFEGILSLSPSDAIKSLKDIISNSDDPSVISFAQLNIGLQLEILGKNTEATAEYLKIIINYPEQKDVVDRAEQRLRDIYKKLEDLSPSQQNQDQSRTVFLSYVKSLYEAYRNQAQYNKAINILEKLIMLDPGNVNYYVDLGDIYLNGLSDPNKAIKLFNNAIRLDPNQTAIYNNLGYSYEKLGDYNRAIYYYKECINISPHLHISQYARNRLEAIELSKSKQLIKDWYLLGPFDNNYQAPFEKSSSPFTAIELDKEYTGKNGGIVKWFRPYNTTSFGYVDLKAIFPFNDFAVAYALTYIYAPYDMDVLLKTGSDGAIIAWVNKQKVINKNFGRVAQYDNDLTSVELKKGWNEVILKLPTSWGSWGFFFRITDARGRPIEKLVFDPMRDPNAVRVIYRELNIKEALLFARNFLIYGTTIIFFLTGLIFMILNIENRIRINKLKSDFVTNVSHQLKTPLTSIKMFAETLKMGKITSKEKTDQYHDLIIREADRLTHFVDTILNFSKIESGQKIYNFEKGDIAKLVRETAERFKQEFIAKDSVLKLNIEDNIPMVELDIQTMAEAIQNLLDNAIKYSKDNKEITINVKRESNYAIIEISDRGSGIAKEELGHIFDKFYRVESPISAGVKGTGLGLSFAKNIVESHKGKIEAHSQVGAGSTFIIKLPINKT